VFFVEARYHRSPERAANQVRYIAHREERLPDGGRRELYGIGARYRAFRGDERAIRKALVEDARGLRRPVYFRFILTVDNRTAERFARLEPRLAERVIRDAVQKTFRSATRGVQGVFAVHQHGGDDRAAHPHVHALLSPRLESGAPTHISPQRIQRVRRDWEAEVLRDLGRQERRLEKARESRTPALPGPLFERQPERPRPAKPAPERSDRRVGPLTSAFMSGKQLGRMAKRYVWDGRWLRAATRLNAMTRDPERAARRTAFRLMATLLPGPMRDALWSLRGLPALGLRTR
jgi:hypothetical protein